MQESHETSCEFFIASENTSVPLDQETRSRSEQCRDQQCAHIWKLSARLYTKLTALTSFISIDRLMGSHTYLQIRKLAFSNSHKALVVALLLKSPA